MLVILNFRDKRLTNKLFINNIRVSWVTKCRCDLLTNRLVSNDKVSIEGLFKDTTRRETVEG